MALGKAGEGGGLPVVLEILWKPNIAQHTEPQESQEASEGKERVLEPTGLCSCSQTCWGRVEGMARPG